MILIMSDSDENSTVYVTQWLLDQGVPFFRINKEDCINLEVIKLSNGSFDFEISNSFGRKLKISEVKSVWYRRGRINFKIPQMPNFDTENIVPAIEEHLKLENAAMEWFFYYLMKEKPHIGTFHSRTVDKLIVLHEAVKLNISIPKSVIATSKNQLESIFDKKVITKAIYEGFSTVRTTGRYVTYTENILEDQIPFNFFPSLFQSEIKKEADIRVFYLLGKFYAMAIRSQENTQTSTDFRKYIKGVGNRSFPFNLPKDLEDKLHKLMVKLELETGSIDLIFTESGEFIFLEVNPVGQFGMTSKPCNYFLEKKIAHTLTDLQQN
jgi:ATP-GRASP peptide maturase of grasp-with-spasm system